MHAIKTIYARQLAVAKLFVIYELVQLVVQLVPVSLYSKLNKKFVLTDLDYLVKFRVQHFNVP